ncbi:unnamed protein product, partial [Adineta steineri]
DMGRRFMRTSGGSNTTSRTSNSPLSTSTTTLEENAVFDANDDRDTNNY